MNLSASVVNIKLYFSLFIFTIFISSYVLCMYDFFFIFFFFFFFFFFSSRRRHTRYIGDWSSDVCSSDLHGTRMKDYGKLMRRRRRPRTSLVIPLSSGRGKSGRFSVPSGTRRQSRQEKSTGRSIRKGQRDRKSVV